MFMSLVETKIENMQGRLLGVLWELGRLDDSSLSYTFYVLVTVHFCIILWIKPTWCTIYS
jgi:hypothetical protein